MEAQQGCLGILYTLQYSIDLAPYDFHIFLELKEHMIHHFLSDDEVICDYLNSGGSAWTTGFMFGNVCIKLQNKVQEKCPFLFQFPLQTGN